MAAQATRLPLAAGGRARDKGGNRGCDGSRGAVPSTCRPTHFGGATNLAQEGSGKRATGGRACPPAARLAAAPPEGRRAGTPGEQSRAEDGGWAAAAGTAVVKLEGAPPVAVRAPRQPRTRAGATRWGLTEGVDRQIHRRHPSQGGGENGPPGGGAPPPTSLPSTPSVCQMVCSAEGLSSVTGGTHAGGSGRYIGWIRDVPPVSNGKPGQCLGVRRADRARRSSAVAYSGPEGG